MSYVYFIMVDGYVKVGTALNPLRRYYQVQSNNPKQATLLAVIPGGKDVELKWHVEFEADYVRGEWFRYSSRIRSAILDIIPESLPLAPTPRWQGKKARVIENRRTKAATGGIIRLRRVPCKTTEVALTRPKNLNGAKDLG